MPSTDMFNDLHQAREDLVRRTIFDGVDNLLRLRHGRDAVVDEEDAISAARAFRHEAEQRMIHDAKKARSKGRSWRDLAKPFGVDDQDDPGMAVFLLVAAATIAPPDAPPRVYWRCQGSLGCQQRVTDTGPVSNDPTVTESGHTENCARHQASIDAYVARNNGRNW